MFIVATAVQLPGTPTAAAPNTPSPATAPPADKGTVHEALAQARRSGKPVEVTGVATSTRTLTANPNGTTTLTQTAVPTRKLVGGAWKPLDPTLVRRADGTVTSTTTTHDITLSGGGTGPIARMVSGHRSLDLTVPMRMPSPTLAGPTATYPDVLPGVDLRATVTDEGGFSPVFVVRNAEAARHPALAKLTLGTKAHGFTLTADKAGNIAGRDRAGKDVITAPAPMMWDSSTRARAGQPTRATSSTARGPGAAARVAPIGVLVAGDKLDLSPDRALLTSSDTVYPVYVDPTFNWSSAGAAMNGWATISRNHQSTNYWKSTPDPHGRMQVGNAGSQWSHTLINFPVPVSTLRGATIDSATFKITNTYSYSCTAKRVNLYAPGATLASSNAKWDHWENVDYGGVIAYKSFAHGYNDDCKAAAESFDITGQIRADVTNSKWTRTLILTGHNEADDVYSWKEFLQTSPTLTITYNHKPNKPSGMRTSPVTSCLAATPTTLGEGPVSLYAPVSDPNGNVLGVSFKLWKSADASQTPVASSNPNLLTYKSGSTAVLVVPMATLRNAAGSNLTGFSWKVQVTDFNMTSDWSATCRFNYDPTRPGAPDVTAPTGDTVVGQQATFQVTPPAGGTIPTSYSYQLNGAPPNTVNATSGNASITVKPNRRTNTLAVTSLSPGGNFGDTASITFNATPAATAADGDLTGDGVPDLLNVGDVSGRPAGLWLAAGQRSGDIVPSATNIGADGNGLGGANRPSDFDGAQVITGRFFDEGFQDVLAYYPAGANAGGGSVLRANGDGSVIEARRDENQITIEPGQLIDDRNNIPLRVVNAGDATGRGETIPDLLGVAGDPALGHYLTYHQSNFIPALYQAPTRLDTPTPAGDMAWNDWTITTAQMSTGASMFLWHHASGKLRLWTNIRVAPETGSLTYTGYAISDTWNPGANLTLQAADINADGIADLWSTRTDGTVKSHLITSLGDPVVTPRPEQPLVTPAHTWPLDDGADNAPATGAVDTTGGATLTASGNAVWHDGDLFSPSLLLNTTANGTAVDTAGTGQLVHNTPLVDTTNSFSLSVRVKPTAAGGVIASADGANSSRFILWDDKTDNTWRFGIATGDTTGWSYDQAIAPAGAQIGVWTHLVATYNAQIRTMSLYVNGLLVDTAFHNPAVTWPSAGKFVVGRYLNNRQPTAYYSGQVSNLQLWNRELTATEVGATNTKRALTGQWSFDTATGATQDTSGNARHLTLTGSPIVGGSGRYGQGLTLNGTSAYASTRTAVDNATGYTICAWAKLDDVADKTYRTIFSQEATRSSGLWLRTNGSAAWQFMVATSDASYQSANAPTAVEPNVWNHVCGVWDPGTSQIMLVVNGTLTAVTSLSSGIAANGPVNIGRHKYLDTYGSYFSGVLDEVRTYVGPITGADEYRAIMEGRLGAAPGTTNAVAARWDFDLATGATTDSSGNLRTLSWGGSATIGAPGRHDEGLTLNGTTAYASSSGVVVNAAGYTICAWAKLDDVAAKTYRAVFSQEANRSSGFWLRTSSTGAWEFVVAISDAGYAAINTPAAAVPASWTHLCGSYDSGTGQMRLFVNGVTIGSKAVIPIATAGPLNIGRYKYLDSYGSHFPGVIDDVRVYVGGITDPARIQEIMNEG